MLSFVNLSLFYHNEYKYAIFFVKFYLNSGYLKRTHFVCKKESSEARLSHLHIIANG